MTLCIRLPTITGTAFLMTPIMFTGMEDPRALILLWAQTPPCSSPVIRNVKLKLTGAVAPASRRVAMVLPRFLVRRARVNVNVAPPTGLLKLMTDRALTIVLKTRPEVLDTDRSRPAS